MLLDFRQQDVNKEIKADLCVIGAGAAGITIAHALINSGIEVCLLESGGLDFDPEIQMLYDGEEVGLEGTDLASCRLRYFGGTTNHWAGWCSPFDAMDFAVRPWVPHSGWPISKEDLDPFYAQANAICGLGPYAYDRESLWPNDGDFLDLGSDKLSIGFWQVRNGGPMRFGTTYRSDLERADNVRVYLFANVTELEVSEDASVVRAAHLRTLDGVVGKAQAKIFAIACGGIENARLLLLSNSVEKPGLGNSEDLVGRYFLQHPRIDIDVLSNDPHYFSRFFAPAPKDGFRVRSSLRLTPEAQTRYQTLGLSAHAFAERDVSEDGYFALKETWEDLSQGGWPDDLGKQLWTVITDLDGAAQGVYDKLRGQRYHGPLKSVRFTAEGEQAPNPDSRVSLADTTDQLGLRRCKVDWRLSELEQKTMLTATVLMASEFERLGLGRIKLPEWVRADAVDWPSYVWGGCHHSGTTRMSETPEHGVVDKNCRVHTVDNLYVAGSSVYPTVGRVNPTLTLVALALRLADHLKSTLKS